MNYQQEDDSIYSDYKYSEDENIYFSEILSILLKYKFFISIISFLGLISGLIYGYITKDLFQGQVILEIPSKRSALIREQRVRDNYFFIYNRQNIETDLEKIKSRLFLNDLYNEFISKKKLTNEYSYQNWRKNIQIKENKDLTLLTINYIDNDTELILKFLNQIAVKMEEFFSLIDNKEFNNYSIYLNNQISNIIDANIILLDELKLYADNNEFDIIDKINPIDNRLKFSIKGEYDLSELLGDDFSEIKQLLLRINNNLVTLDELYKYKNQYQVISSNEIEKWKIYSKPELFRNDKLNQTNRNKITLLFLFVSSFSCLLAILIFEKFTKKVYSVKRIQEITNWKYLLQLKYNNRNQWKEIIQHIKTKYEMKSNTKIGIIFIGSIDNNKIQNLYKYLRNDLDNIILIENHSILNLNKYSYILPITCTGITKYSELKIIKSKLDIIDTNVEEFINIL